MLHVLMALLWSLRALIATEGPTALAGLSVGVLITTAIAWRVMRAERQAEQRED